MNESEKGDDEIDRRWEEWYPGKDKEVIVVVD